MTDKTQDQPSYLEMSDEDILNAPPPQVEGFTLEDSTEDKEPEPSSEEKKEEVKDGDEDPEGSAADEGTEGSKEGEADEGDEDKDGSDPEGDKESDKDPEAKDKKVASEDEVKEAEEKAKESQVDYEAEYKKILAPFKANGKEIQVQSVEDAIALMQMGANYNKKMAALKPNLALLKLLEKNNLLDEGKLSFLIDLDKKNPEAINKLVKDSGLDPMDLSAEKASEYKPNTYAVDEKEVELDTVIEEIKDSETYARTIDLVGNKWDAASRKAVADSPQMLKVINQHMENGVYDLIAAEMERERLFNRLGNLSDIQAYKQIGDAINARGGFDHLFKKQGTQTIPPKTNAPKTLQADIDKLKDKKRAASSTKAAVAAPADTKDFNPLGMSDEEFAKVSIEKFMTK